MKKALFTVSILFLTLFTACASSGELTEQSQIAALFEENKELILSSVESGDFTQVEKIPGIQQISVSEDGSYADFYCGGKGFGSNTSYCGFFYSAAGDMTALDGGICAPKELVPSGQGYMWAEENGDNEYYVEPLDAQFFYYYLKY